MGERAIFKMQWPRPIWPLVVHLVWRSMQLNTIVSIKSVCKVLALGRSKSDLNNWNISFSSSVLLLPIPTFVCCFGARTRTDNCWPIIHWRSPAQTQWGRPKHKQSWLSLSLSLFSSVARDHFGNYNWRTSAYSSVLMCFWQLICFACAPLQQSNERPK